MPLSTRALQKKRLYLNEFECWNRPGQGSWETKAVIQQFQVEEVPWSIEDEPECVFASYVSCCYSGTALVVFKKNGLWYIAEGSHCSCYGLEDQWKPDEFSPEDVWLAFEQGKKYITAPHCCGSQGTDDDFYYWFNWVTTQ